LLKGNDSFQGSPTVRTVKIFLIEIASAWSYSAVQLGRNFSHHGSEVLVHTEDAAIDAN